MKKSSIMAFWLSAALCGSALNAHAAAGEGILLGGLTLTPLVEGSATYDTNVWRAPERGKVPSSRGELSDVYFAAKLQLALAAETDLYQARAEGWHRIQRYRDVRARDTDELGARLQLHLGTREALRLTLYQRYAEVDQYDRGPAGRDLADMEADVEALVDPSLQDRVALGQRKVYSGHTRLGRDLTEKSTLDAEVHIHSVRYQEAGTEPLATVTLNDTVTYRLTVETGWRITDKTTLFLAADGARHDSDAFDRDADLLAARAGLSTLTTEKLRFRAAAGVMRYRYETQQPAGPDGPAGAGTTTERSENLSMELGAWWRPADRWLFRAAASTGYQPAVQYLGNATYDLSGQLSAGYRIARHLQASVSAGARREDYQRPVSVADPAGGRREIDKYVNLATYSARLAYRPADAFFAWHVEVREDRALSNEAAAEYRAAQATTGLTVWY